MMAITETKGLTLEQLDEVFSIPTKTHIYHSLRTMCSRSAPLASSPSIALSSSS